MMTFSKGVETFDFFSLASIVLFFAMLFLMDVGFRLGRSRAKRLGEDGREGLGSSETAVLGLLGLILAFTFGGAGARRETRQELIADEANAIGTAYLRLDLLQGPDRTALQALFRQYVDARLAAYEALPDIQRVQAMLSESTGLQNRIWHEATAACRTASPPVTLLLLPAINSMIDITGTRTMALMIHPPTVIFALLFGLALLSALLAGHGMAAARQRSLLHMLIFAGLTSMVIFVIINLEAPRLGLLRIESSDRMLIQLREHLR